MGQVVGVDVGGTFTDLIVLDDATGAVSIAKVPSTPDNQAFGVLAAIEQGGARLSDIDTIVHGTTVTTNALLERKIATCGLITTVGFRDILELGRRTRPKPYGLTGSFNCLIPRERRLEVIERMDSDGEIVRPLDEDSVRLAIKSLIDAGVESLVIHFLHSYINDAHEVRAEEIAREMWPNEFITRGSFIMAEYREYERGTTAMINASIQPVLSRYIQRLREELQSRGYAHDLLVMQGNGGMVSSEVIADAAVNTVMSGPASGVMAAAYTATAAGYPDVITCDMGGTSCDVGLIRDGVPQVSSELEIEYAMPIHVPMVDVHTIGAGGGSIAWINAAGILEVGPESAGAVPGPICYGKGGTQPTISDANLVLGRMSPDALLATDAKISLADVADALMKQIAEPLGLASAEAAAAAIIQVANNKMAGALRMVSLAKGHDPRDFALFPFGGAGPLHAAALARELGVPRVLIPARPGITNAVGCVVADVRHDYVNTINTPLPAVDMARIADIFRDQERRGREMIAREGIEVDDITVLHDADMQFQGQTHILTVPVTSPDITRDELHAIFETAYWDRFAVELSEIRPVVVNLHTAVIGKRKGIELSALMDADERTATTEEAKTGTRQVWFGGASFETPIYRREKLPLGAKIEGPAILEQLDTTIVVEPSDSLVVDDFGNVILSVQQLSSGS
jgi:N-methylhydantoinase A